MQVKVYTIDLPSWLKSKFIWLNILAVAIFVANQIVTSQVAPAYTTWINIAVASLTLISNMIAGASTSSRAARAEAKAKMLEAKLNPK